MIDDNRIIRFDWAAKRILRDKANFDVLEGLITVLLNEQVHIVEALSFPATDKTEDKLLKDSFLCIALNKQSEHIRIYFHLIRELYYRYNLLMEKPLKSIESFDLGQKYDQVKKVYSISILYFDLGKGADYLYHGTTVFRGVHTGDVLEISTKDRDAIRMRRPDEIFPEYFIIRVNEFNDVATTPLEEWLDYLKNDHIREDTKVPGLQEARHKLQYLKMNRDERLAYDRHVDNVMVQNDVLDTARAEGREEGRAETISMMLKGGIPIETIAQALGLTSEEIREFMP